MHRSGGGMPLGPRPRLGVDSGLSPGAPAGKAAIVPLTRLALTLREWAIRPLAPIRLRTEGQNNNTCSITIRPWTTGPLSCHAFPIDGIIHPWCFDCERGFSPIHFHADQTNDFVPLLSQYVTISTVNSFWSTPRLRDLDAISGGDILEASHANLYQDKQLPCVNNSRKHVSLLAFSDLSGPQVIKSV